MSKDLKYDNKKKIPGNSNNFHAKSEKIESHSKKRVYSMIDELYSMFDRYKLDPILETFKSNELLKEFYMKRIFELMKVRFSEFMHLGKRI